MSIRFYTTEVAAEKTAREMQQILAESDARRVSMEYDGDGHPTSIQFVLLLDGNPLPFRVEPDAEAMRKALNQDDDTPGRFDLAQARRVAWRIWKEWTNAVLAFRDTRQASVDQLLLGFGVTPDGATVYDRLVEDRKLLTAGQ